MADLYRKSALDKMSSPEQLDKAIVIVPPSFWLAMLGAALIIITALLWAIFGRLPLNVSANGIFMNRAGIRSVYSEAGGTVEAIETGTGDHVEKGDVIARLSSEEQERKLADLLTRKQYVEDVTLTSVADIATDDNKDLLDLKSRNLAEDSYTQANPVFAEQFDTEKNAVLTRLNREIAECEATISKNTIHSSVDGTVTELSVVEGQVIAAGDYVARVSSGNTDDNVVVCYVPVAEGRRIKKGMSASIYPSTANKQEYGHMKGTVEYVDGYVTSRAEITNQVGVVSLVDSFLKNGPVVEVRLELEKDEDTQSGYWWSSKKGNEIELVKGTMVAADISIEEKQPISMLVPYLKEKLTVKKQPAENEGDE